MELRPLTTADAEIVLAMRIANREHFLTGEPARDARWFTLDAQLEALAALEDERAAGTREQFGVFTDDGALAGYVSLSQIFRAAFLNAYLGYAIDHRHVGRGLASAAVAATVDHAWSLGLHRVQANVATTNAASRRVLEKNGFRHEGTALRYLHIGGSWTDHDMFAKTREES